MSTMEGNLLFDVEINVINEQMFKVILDAELKYHNVYFSCLNKFQIQGKALKMMGINSDMGEISKIGKVIPFIYKRKLSKPKERWKFIFTCSTFKPAFTLAKKKRCLKIVIGTHYTSSIVKECLSKNNTVLKNLSLHIDRSSIGSQLLNSFNKQCYEFHSRNLHSVSSINMEKLPNSTQTECLCSKEICDSILPQIPAVNTRKSSESMAILDWSSQSPVRKKERSHKTKSVKINDYFQDVKNIANKENTKKVHVTTKTRQAITKALILRSRNQENNSSSEESEHSLNVSKSSAGCLASLFGPISKKRYSPTKLLPIIKIHGTPISSEYSN